MKPDHWNISNAIIKFILTVILGIAIGYGWAYKIYLSDNSKCEKDSIKLENEFEQAHQKGYSFHIFNSQFEIYPISVLKRQFAYRKVNND